MTQEECQFCHKQEAPGVVEKAIRGNGYYTTATICSFSLASDPLEVGSSETF